LAPGYEQTQHFASYSATRADAREKAGLGDDAVPFVQEIGPQKGRVTGMQSPDGLRGWRVDFDPGNPEKGFHVNWWARKGPKQSDGWQYGANIIKFSNPKDAEQAYYEVLAHLPYT
jgi:hypothetical protein